MPDLSNLNMTQIQENGGFINSTELTELLATMINFNFSQLLVPAVEYDWQSLYSEDCNHVDTFSVSPFLHFVYIYCITLVNKRLKRNAWITLS